MLLFLLLICSLQVFTQSSSDSKCSQLSRTFQSILVDRCSAVVWIVLVLSQISSPLILFSRFLEIV